MNKAPFKLGTARGLEATGGNIRNKMRFHKEAGGDASVPGTPVIRKDLEDGVLGEANMDGTIYVSDKVQPGSPLEREVLGEEIIHATDIKLGKMGYTDNSVYYDGITYPRETRNGKDMIKVDGEWKEAGTHDFPWEKAAKPKI
tara:strand:+ start:266 stop:694 length:429 start_codon:yes stop_codon:yes gene_type:complete